MLQNTKFTFRLSASVVSNETSMDFVKSILKPAALDVLLNWSGITLFLPVDSAWAEFNDVERAYLESEYSSKDVLDIFYMHLVAGEDVFWSDSFETPMNGQ